MFCDNQLSTKENRKSRNEARRMKQLILYVPINVSQVTFRIPKHRENKIALVNSLYPTNLI